jgi:hypothetical protein
VENTPTVALALARQSNAKTCASLTLECRPEAGVRVVLFSGRGHGRLLRGMRVQVTRRKPGQAVTAAFDARSWQAKAPAPQNCASRACPTLLSKNFHSCGAGAFACQPVFSHLPRERRV